MIEFSDTDFLPYSCGVTFSADEFIEQGKAAWLRCAFELDKAEKLPVWVAGVAGYRLYLDKCCVHCGPEWSHGKQLIADFITLELAAGKHTLEVLLWNHGLKKAAYREMNHHAFFVLKSLQDSPAARAVDTAWGFYETSLLPGWKICQYHMSCMAGPRLETDFRIPAESWQQAVRLDEKFFQKHDYKFIRRELPLDVVKNYQNYTLRSGDVNVQKLDKFYEVVPRQLQNIGQELVRGNTVVIPPRQQIRLLFDLNDYICARAVFDADKGQDAVVEIMLTESLFEHSPDWVSCYKNPIKGNRSQIAGKYAAGTGDKFTFDGSVQHCPVLDWDAGRYLVCYINTTSEELIIKNFHLEQTHSGIKLTQPIRFADEKLNKTAGICVNSLKNCLHTTYMDCPHYEQLMYIGDGRLEALINYVCAPGSSMQRKALKTFAASVQPDGFTQNRYPSREKAVIPGFSLFFINMLHDYALWSSDRRLVGELLEVCKNILNAFDKYRNSDGLYNDPPYWNFYDWVPGWECGVPPTGGEVGALMNLHMVTALNDLADLEEYAGSAECAVELRQRADAMRKNIHQQFFVPEKGIYSCDKQHRHFSQHVQAMALLAGLGNRELYEKIFDKSLDLAQCTIYFAHYLFEAAKLFGDSLHPLEMFEFWKALPDQGFFTTPERPEPSRSDCHAWGSHILYYMVTGLAGVHPVKPGGKHFAVTPADLTGVEAFELELALENGTINVSLSNGKISYKATDSIILQ